MGSLRTPVGPLPSSIYWRRRGVLLLLIAVVALLIIWALRPGGGGDEEETAGGDDGRGGPAESITPGPTPSESLIDERPGGRDDPPGGDEDGEGDGEAGSEGGEDDDADDDPSGDGDGDGSADGGGSGLDPAGVPACVTAAVTVTLSSASNEYAAGEEPELRLTAENGSGSACRLDFGHDELTVLVTDEDDNEVWSSAECPEGPGSDPVAVAAGDSVTHTLTWDRRHSPEDCEGSQGRAAAAGTYVAKAQLPDHPVAQISFVLDND
ncbi:hypothetical protein [Streptomyces radicis]|uniref:DUF4232 domain-containing protein n=1 Tax=Streptomyces radicis TaxID=1750517 RepID=A0A3A9W9R3_9ACTN|nr:hypothetical protein [Streptomyces radicis]RKN10031.1 hypothetical protein D7319_09605 [Streptomyces radicis]RKN24372.1 hypothetical protein D7318_10785 [Streptomyces radicis]